MTKPSKKKVAKKASKKKVVKKASKKKVAKKKVAKKMPKKASKKKASKKKASKKMPKKAPKKKASKKAPKARRRRRSPEAKLRAAKVSLKRVSKSASKAARALGMIKGARKNPGGILGFMKQEVSDFMALAPSIAVQLGTMAAIGFASSKASEQIRKRATAGGAMDKYAGAISSGAITIAAFAAMKMMKNEKSKQFTLPVLFGGMAATLVQVLAAVKVKPAKGAAIQADISLGQRLGLPIGEYTAISGYLDVHGRQIAINGMGEYVDQPLGSFDIHPDRYKEGTVISMGEYVDQPLGELTLHQGRYQEGTVLGGVHSQMSEGRQGARALGARGDDRVEDFIIDSGSLAGSVFD